MVGKRIGLQQANNIKVSSLLIVSSSLQSTYQEASVNMQEHCAWSRALDNWKYHFELDVASTSGLEDVSLGCISIEPGERERVHRGQENLSRSKELVLTIEVLFTLPSSRGQVPSFMRSPCGNFRPPSRILWRRLSATRPDLNSGRTVPGIKMWVVAIYVCCLGRVCMLSACLLSNSVTMMIF